MQRICARLTPADVPLRGEASVVLYLVSPDYALRPGRARTVRARPGAIEAGGSRVLLLRGRRSGRTGSHGRDLAGGRARDAPRRRSSGRARAGGRWRPLGALLEWRGDVGDERYLRGLSRICRDAAGAALAIRASMARGDRRALDASAVPVEHVSRLRRRGGSGVLRRRRRAGGAPGRGGGAAGVAPTHALLTHHHFDHVCEFDQLRARWPELKVLTSAPERELLRGRHRARGAGRGGGRHDRGRAGAAVRGARGAPAAHARSHGGMLSFLVGERGDKSAAGARPQAPVRGAAPGGFSAARRRCSRVTRCSRTPWAASKPGPHHLRRPAGLDHGHADGAAARDGYLSGARRRDDGRAEWDSNGFIRVWRGSTPEG